MKFGHLILRKIIKFVGTRCWILRLKGTKFNFGWGSAPDPARGAYSAPQAHPPGSGGCGCPDPQNFHGGGRVRVLRVILAKSCDESAFSIHSSCRLRHTVNEAYMWNGQNWLFILKFQIGFWGSFLVKFYQNCARYLPFLYFNIMLRDTSSLECKREPGFPQRHPFIHHSS